jgi:hypothetical protein
VPSSQLPTYNPQCRLSAARAKVALMELLRKMQAAALHMRELAQDTKLPGYAAKMLDAAEDLEKRASERAQLRGFAMPLPIAAEID